MKFKELETVKIKRIRKRLWKAIHCSEKDIKRAEHARGLIVGRNLSAFGETYWIHWCDNGEETLMHGDQLRKAKFDFLPS